MQLDFNPALSLYFLRVPRAALQDIEVFQKDHGLDFSTTASTPTEAVFFTDCPWAAVTFFELGTDRVKENLKRIHLAIEESWKPISNINVEVPYGKELWGFQKANVEYARSRPNVLIGDQPGLGKTNTAIAIANERQSERNLVLCPANIRLQWADRIREWSTMRNPYVVYPIMQSSMGVHPRASWTICSYDLARRDIVGSLLAKMEYDTLILDEPHYLKDSGSLRAKAVFGGGRNRKFEPIASKAKGIVALTGTPLPNRPREAFTLAKGLCWDSIDWQNEDDFKHRFNPSVRKFFMREDGTAGIFNDERSGRYYELQNRLRSHIMSRHLKHGPNGVMPQLQMPVYSLVVADETGPVRQALEAESLLHIDPEQFEGADLISDGQISVVRHMMGVAIAPQVVEYAKMLLDGGEEKLTIFAWHTDVLDILQEKLHSYGVIRIDGSTSPTQRQRCTQQFIHNDKIHLAIGNILSMGIGTDGLQQVCNHGIIAEPDWVLGNNVQCFDRLDRGGQRQQVQGEIFVAPNSIMEKVLASALRKGRNVHKSLDDRWIT